MKLVKPALDVGIQIAAADPASMLAFHRDTCGLVFDHALPLGGGRMQERHGWGDSVIKLNHRRGGAAPAPATGWQGLTLRGPAFETSRRLADPEGNVITLAPGADRHVEIELRVRDADASRDFFAALGLGRDGDGRIEVGASRICVVEDPDAPVDAPMEGPGFRYVTLQIARVDDAHMEALAAGGREGMAPRTLGEVARISFVLEPGGNWIELSQRASLVGDLSP